MIDHPAYGVDPWIVREVGLDFNVLAQSESVFALSNGHIGWRGNLDEGEPHGLPGSYLNGVYELRPLPYAESGYGYPQSGETVINVTNGKLIRLHVDDEPFDVRYGELQSHERALDMRAGTLTRTARWRSPVGTTVEVESTRLVSLTHRAIAAVRYEVRAVDPVRLVVQSELVANESLPDPDGDPRSAAAPKSPLVRERSVAYEQGLLMVHRTRVSGLRVGVAAFHKVDGPERTTIDSDVADDVGRYTVITHLEPGQRLVLVKVVAHGWSSRRSLSALHDQVAAAAADARQSGWDGLLAEQRAFLDDFWAGADVEVEGDGQVQQAVRFGLFHIIQAAARAEQRPIPAKGLTGPGYDGHTFWDSETYVLPVLTYSYPTAAADALAWRASTLPTSVEHAQELGLAGAAFAWRTITGRECSGYWPAGTAAFHINADIADAALRYVDATRDAQFEERTALPLVVQTARMWRSLGQHDMDGRFRIDGVTGPDEYSAVADNNVYTNLMAQRNLLAAAEMCRRLDRAAEALSVDREEMASWRDAAEAMTIPWDERLGVHPQSEGFTSHARWDFASTGPDKYPLLLHFPYFQLYRKQVVKQADLVLAMVLCGEAFSPEQKRRNFEYYEELTVRDSSLSAGIQAVMAAEVGHLDLAYDYLGEAALMDLRDIEHNTKDGLHIASLAGSWLALVVGFGGLRTAGGTLCFSPSLPQGLAAIRFKVRYRGRRIGVDILPTEARYRLLDGPPVAICHHGQEVRLDGGEVTKAIGPAPALPRPSQPRHRSPLPHRPRKPTAAR